MHQRARDGRALLLAALTRGFASEPIRITG
jgi:hypothetical protein